MSIITIVGAGMMGTAMCWPLADNHHTVRLVGTPLDEQIVASLNTNRIHPKLERSIPAGVAVFGVDELARALEGADLVIGGVSSFGVSWMASEVLPRLPPGVPLLSVTKGLEDLPDGTLLNSPRSA